MPRRAASRTSVAIGVALVALAATLAVAPIPAALVERYYSVGVFPVVQRALTPISNQLPIAALDILAIAVAVFVFTVIARSVRDAWMERSIGGVVRMLGRLIVLGSCLYVVFLLAWGLNYRRLPMAARLVLDQPAPTSDQVLRLGLRAVGGMNQTYLAAHREGGGDVWLDGNLRRAFAEVQRALSDAPIAEPGRPKASLLAFYFRWAGVDGMINPFGLEVLVNPDLLPFERPFVTAHEWGHLAGYADESEANLVGWLTCMRASPAARYSGWLYLYWEISSEVDAAGRERLAAALERGPRLDVDAVVARVRRGQIPALQRASWQVYDQYLKANRVEAGVRSYGAVVSLILRARFTDEWIPLRRAVPGGRPRAQRLDGAGRRWPASRRET